MDESGQGPAEGVTYQASLPGTSEEGAVLDESMLERYRPTAKNWWTPEPSAGAGGIYSAGTKARCESEARGAEEMGLGPA